MAHADDLGLDEKLVTPRSLYRNNPERVVEKGALPSRDPRFVVESGLMPIPRPEPSSQPPSESPGLPKSSSPKTSPKGTFLPASPSKQRAPEAQLAIPSLRRQHPQINKPTDVSKRADSGGQATLLWEPIARSMTGNEKRVDRHQPRVDSDLPRTELGQPQSTVSQNRAVALKREVVSERNQAFSSQGDKASPAQDAPRLQIDPTLQLRSPMLNDSTPIPVPKQPTLVDPDFDQQRFSMDRILESARSTSIFSDRPAVMLSVNDLLARTLINAKAVKILRIQPIEDRQIVDQEFGQFDWTAFFENRLTRNNTPVGQLNQADPGQLVIRGDDLQFQAGLRKATTTGGQIEVRESFRFLDDNSGRLLPNDQAISALTLVYSQELLRDGGRDVVLSQALVAGYQADQSHAQSVARISELLQTVLNQYWQLFEIRGNYFVQLAQTRWAHETLMQLQSRQHIDAQENTIQQARALLLEAQANLVDAKAQVRIAQDQLFRLVNDPALHPEHVEIIATHPPLVGSVLFDPRTELETALQNRGEIYERIAAISEAAVQHHVSLNQLLPKLTVSLQSSINGIEGDRNIFAAQGTALGTQPTVAANFNLEFFLSNRTARATNRQTQLALRRLQYEYEDAIEQVRLDVSQAIRTLNASSEVLDLRRQTLAARRQELDYLRLRRDVIPQVDASVSLLLEQFFLALSRLVASQQAYLQAIGNQQRSLADLQRAKGMLIRSDEVPQEGFVPVPSIPKALEGQWHHKEAMVQTIDRTVVQPSMRQRWPHQATLQTPFPTPAKTR